MDIKKGLCGFWKRDKNDFLVIEGSCTMAQVEILKRTNSQQPNSGEWHMHNCRLHVNPSKDADAPNWTILMLLIKCPNWWITEKNVSAPLNVHSEKEYL